MSTFLTHLIAREQQALPAVKPRPIARFESAPAQGIELATFTEQGAALETASDAQMTETTPAALPPTFAPPSAGRHTPYVPPLQRRLWLPRSPQRQLSGRPPRRPPHLRSPHRSAPWHESRADMAQPAGERSPFTVQKSPPDNSQQQSSAQAAPLPPPQPAQSQERGATSAGEVEIQVIERQTIERLVSPPEPIAVPTPRAITPAMEHGARSAVRPRVALARDQAEQRAAFTPPAPPPAPTINVTIGRIEIKASPPARSPRRSPPPTAPIMTLETYLQQRTGGQ